MLDDATAIEGGQQHNQEVKKAPKVSIEQPKTPLIPTREEKTPSVESLGLNDKLKSEGEIAQVREKLAEEKDAYENSTLITKLKERLKLGLPLRIAFFDIDNTLTGTPQTQKEARQLLEEKGYTVVFVTSRTEEMVMSKRAYEKSVESGFTRKEPKLGDDQGKRVNAFADEVEPFKGLYDPDVIAGTTGARTYVKQETGGFQTDTEFDKTLKGEAAKWREDTLQILKLMDPDSEFLDLSAFDDNADRYEEGKTDVFTPDFRIGLDLEKVKEKINGVNPDLFFLQKFRELRKDPRLTEELTKHMSNIIVGNDANPDTGKFIVYLNPKRGVKVRAVENVVDNVCKGLSSEDKKVARGDLELLIAGDSFPDLAMGFYGGVGTNATFLIPGGARLTNTLTSKDVPHFAGEEVSAIKNRMSERGVGEFDFRMPLGTLYGGSRRVVMGDQAYPGTKSVDTVIQYLKGQK